MTAPPVVHVAAIRKAYGQTVAVDAVSFDVRQGEIFVREPLGLIGSVAVPVVLFVLLGRTVPQPPETKSSEVPSFAGADLPVFVSILIALSAVLSLVTIIAIYREGGILKRLRATPLRPYTILTAHVIVKLLLTAVTLAMLVLAGRRFYPIGTAVPLASFTLALLFSTLCILSMGFLIASIVPTARFAQPIGGLLFYPMLGVSGLFYPVEALSPTLQIVARVLPLTYALSLLRGIWRGEGWLAHLGDVAVLVMVFLVCTTLSSKVFRWE